MSIPYQQTEFDKTNPEPRCPCVLLLDNSGSMSGEPLRQLNDGLQAFAQSLKQDPLAALRVEVAVVTFGPVKVHQDFVTADSFVPPRLEAAGDTPMGAAINQALDMVDARKRLYKANGVRYYQPWVFMITDGGPTDSWQPASSRLRQLEQDKRVAFFSVGVQNADMDTLKQISVRQPNRLDGLKFESMFVWLSQSLHSVSHSQPGDKVPLQEPLDWRAV